MANSVIIDPRLYMKKVADVFWIPQCCRVPTTFKLFTGEQVPQFLGVHVEFTLMGHAGRCHHCHCASKPRGEAARVAGSPCLLSSICFLHRVCIASTRTSLLAVQVDKSSAK